MCDPPTHLGNLTRLQSRSALSNSGVLSEFLPGLAQLAQGQHADYEGLGNRSSIGIEMCENRGNSREVTLEKTAQLTAYLLKKHRIPLSRVVPHQHWRMIRYSDGRDLGHKNCPNFLMTNGKPGWKWQAFLNRIKKYL